MSAAITYKPVRGGEWLSVKLGSRFVGNIAPTEGGYHFIAKGGHTGETFATIDAVKASLEGND
jgi:hypothetical protein